MKMLYTKLATKINCDAPIPSAQMVMNWFIGCNWRNVS